MQLLGEEGTQKTSVDQYPALTDYQFLNCEFIVGLDMSRIGTCSVVVSSLNPLVKMILNGSGSVDRLPLFGRTLTRLGFAVCLRGWSTVAIGR
jgi:hypothetical protein